MTHMVVVLRSFEANEVGDIIDDAQVISSLSASEYAHHVVRVAVAPTAPLQLQEF